MILAPDSQTAPYSPPSAGVDISPVLHRCSRRHHVTFDVGANLPKRFLTPHRTEHR
jgi:hypothetical protein